MQIECPSCGANIEISPADRHVVCEYCESSLHVELGGDLTKTTFKIKIPRSNLPGLLTRGLKSRELREPAKIQRIRMLYFPFWRFETSVRTELFPAASTMHRALGRYEMEDGELEFFTETDLDETEVIRPNIYLDAVLSSARLDQNASDDPVKPSLLFVPFYDTVFTYGGREYQVFVTANTGVVMFDSLPPAVSVAMSHSFAMTAVLIFLVYLTTSYLITRITGSFTIAIFACMGLTFLSYKWLSKVIIR